MDEKAVRSQLAEIESELQRNEEERQVLNDLISGYRGWLKLRAVHGASAPPPPGLAARLAPSARPATHKARTKSIANKPKGSVSMRSAVLQAIQEANGKAIHVKDILERVTALGARSEGREPKGVVDLMAYSLARRGSVEKVGPRLWRWTGEIRP